VIRSQAVLIAIGVDCGSRQTYWAVQAGKPRMTQRLERVLSAVTACGLHDA
jgi:hypothetical protein